MAQGLRSRHGQAGRAAAVYFRIQAPPGAAGGEDQHAAISAATGAIPSPMPSGTRDDDCHRPLRAVAHRPAACRQCPHRAAELAVRAKRWAANSCCGSTTPMRRVPTKAFEEAIYRDLAWLGLTHDGTDRQINRLTHLQHRFLPAAGGGPHLSLLRNRSRTGAPALACWRRASCRRSTTAPRWIPPTSAQWEAEGRKPHWRFKLSRSKVQLDRSGARAGGDRHRHHVRSGAGARGRRLSLYPAVGGRRYRHGHQPCGARRGSCHQHRRRRSKSSKRWARPCPRFAHFPLLVGAGGEALSQAAGFAVAGTACARTASSRWRWRPISPRSAPPIRSSRACRWANWPAEFDFAKIGRAPAHFVPEELDGAERQDAAHRCPTSAVAPRCAAGCEAFWDAIKPNLTKLSRRRRTGAAGRPAR